MEGSKKESLFEVIFGHVGDFWATCLHARFRDAFLFDSLSQEGPILMVFGVGRHASSIVNISPNLVFHFFLQDGFQE